MEIGDLETPTHQRGEEQADDGQAAETDRWTRRLALAVYGAAALAGLVLAGGFAARQEWTYAVVSLALFGWTLLIEGAATSARRPTTSGTNNKPAARLPLAVVRLVARTSNTVFGVFVILAALALLRGTPAVWSAVVVAAALISWDLHFFRDRLKSVERVSDVETITRGHLSRLAVVVLCGLGLGLAALLIRVRFGVGLLVALSLLAIFGLSRAITYIRRASD